MYLKYFKVRLSNRLEFLEIITPDHESRSNKKKIIFPKKLLHYFFLTNKKLKRKQRRLELYNEFFAKRDFSGLMNGASWWKKNVFI